MTAPTEEAAAGRRTRPNEDDRPRRVAAAHEKRRGIDILPASSGALIAALLFRWLV